MASNSIAVLVSTVLVKQLGVDTSLYIPIHNVIDHIFSTFSIASVSNIFNKLYYLIIIGIFFLIIICCIKYTDFKNFEIFSNIWTRNKYEHLLIACPTKCKQFNTYFMDNIDYITNKIDFEISSSDIEFMILLNEHHASKNVITTLKPCNDKKIYFNDIKFNIQGYFVWNLETKEKKTLNNDDEKKSSNESYYINTVDVYINSNNKIGIHDYYNKVSDEYKQKMDRENSKSLEYIQVNIDPEYEKNERIQYNSFIFSNKIDSGEHIMKTFFHKDYDYILKLINAMKPENENYFTRFGQVPKLGLCHYGPPGCGKSSTAYKFAGYLRRSIMKFNPLILSKEEVFQILAKPKLDEEYSKTSDFIFMMDEIDEIFYELLRREDIKEKYKKDLLKHKKNQEFNMFNFAIPTAPPTDSKKSDDKKDTKLSFGIEAEIEKYNNQLSFNELLEILQGVVPHRGLIIIATTNKYEEMISSKDPRIKFACEQMFRHGRLTPIYYGHYTGLVIKKILKHYFDEDYKIRDDAKLKINNSMLMEVIQINIDDNINGYNNVIKVIEDNIEKEDKEFSIIP